jgi:hypothetical protein
MIIMELRTNMSLLSYLVIHKLHSSIPTYLLQIWVLLTSSLSDLMFLQLRLFLRILD